jgi:hypothetical protein
MTPRFLRLPPSAKTSWPPTMKRLKRIREKRTPILSQSQPPKSGRTVLGNE